MDTDNRIQQKSSLKRSMQIVLWSLSASVALSAIKIVSGFLGNSYALIADGLESMLDVIGALIVLGSLRLASQAPTDRYPFGFGRIEPLAALALASIILAAAVGISVQSVHEIITPHHTPASFTLLVLLAVIVAKEIMFRVLNKTGRSIGSQAIMTDAWHHRADSLTSIAAFVGISIALIGGQGFETADDWAALFASGVIAYNGVRLFAQALQEILDIKPAPEVEKRIRDLALTVAPVEAVEKCLVRKSGLFYFVEVHIELEGSISVERGHRIAHQVKDKLLGADLRIMDVVVHIEPLSPFSSSDVRRPGDNG